MSTRSGLSSGRAPASLASARAMIEEAVLARWQLWHTWLTLSAERLAIQEQQGDEAAAFDLDEAHGVARLRAVEAQLGAIPAAVRAEFQAIYELKSTEVAERLEGAPQAGRGRAGGDVFAVEQAAYRELIAVCVGDPAQGRRGEVPLDGEWYEVDTRMLQQVPGAERFALSLPARRLNATNIAIAIGLVALIGLFIAIQPRQGRAATIVARAPAVLVADAPVAPWRPLALTLASEATALAGAAEIAVAPAAYDAWPPRDLADGAAWREGSAWPVELCLPGARIGLDAAWLRLISAGEAPTRVYRLSATPPGPGPAALVLRDCAGDPARTRYGALESSAAPPAATLGERLSLPDGQQIALEALQVLGPSQDALLPEGRVRVLVTAAGAGIDDWSALRPTLLLASGEEVALSASPQLLADGRVVLTYLVGSFDAPLPVAWQVSDLATGRVARWRATLAPPPARLADLDAALRVGAPEAALFPSGQLRLRIPLRNVGERPLAIRADDLVVRQGAAQVALPALSPEAGAIAPGAAITLTLDLALPNAEPTVTIAIGRSVFALDLPEGR